MSLFKKLSHASPFFLIAGPCVIEEMDTMFRIAEHLVNLARKSGIELIFKSSYKKANRSSGDSYSGPGMEAGLKLLAKLKAEFGFPLLTDVHECAEVKAAAEVCEILQIPAFLSRQTDLIQAAAMTKRIINIKKGQFMAPEDMRSAALKANAVGNEDILLTERGSSFGYHNLVVDFRGFAIMREFGLPIVYDVTHSLQRPSLGTSSGGNPEYAMMMAQAAIATGKVTGLFVETHIDPAKAKSDAATMLPLAQMERLIINCKKIGNTVEELGAEL
ncbi:MAG: 3-deoxy-8-phosphooctulonate synthase [Candidatus Cloacimonadaceae bacterium]|nr:3-deoxy-8-phosphooctulonate synthase [Candidatus Cloacimonadaceae bacterium]MDP3114227.1 3-deoxy-8-phosphooctulonate synthase [Candidatus Cloacimonadaceae bacterium]